MICQEFGIETLLTVSQVLGRCQAGILTRKIDIPQIILLFPYVSTYQDRVLCLKDRQCFYLLLSLLACYWPTRLRLISLNNEDVRAGLEKGYFCKEWHLTSDILTRRQPQHIVPVSALIFSIRRDSFVPGIIFQFLYILTSRYFEKLSAKESAKLAAGRTGAAWMM